MDHTTRTRRFWISTFAALAISAVAVFKIVGLSSADPTSGLPCGAFWLGHDNGGTGDAFGYGACETTRVSVASDGTRGNATSTFDGQEHNTFSGDGRYVVFQSNATNLVSGDTNGKADIFIRDRTANTTARVNVATDGTQATWISVNDPAISADGRFIAFDSDATNLVAGDTNGLRDVFVHDRDIGTTTRICVATGGTQATGG